jgi:hypothetical protein
VRAQRPAPKRLVLEELAAVHVLTPSGCVVHAAQTTHPSRPHRRRIRSRAREIFTLLGLLPLDRVRLVVLARRGDRVGARARRRAASRPRARGRFCLRVASR